jgi:hypothetical protein
MIHPINILSTDEGKAQPGFDSSIEKWYQIGEAIREIQVEANAYCGLCWEAMSHDPEHYGLRNHCATDCLYKGCPGSQSNYMNVHNHFQGLRKAIDVFRDDLIECRRAAKGVKPLCNTL